MGMRNLFSSWVPRLLTTNYKQNRMTAFIRRKVMGLPQHIGVQAAVEIWASLGELATNKAKVNASVKQQQSYGEIF